MPVRLNSEWRKKISLIYLDHFLPFLRSPIIATCVEKRFRLVQKFKNLIVWWNLDCAKNVLQLTNFTYRIVSTCGVIVSAFTGERSLNIPHENIHAKSVKRSSITTTISSVIGKTSTDCPFWDSIPPASPPLPASVREVVVVVVQLLLKSKLKSQTMDIMWWRLWCILVKAPAFLVAPWRRPPATPPRRRSWRPNPTSPH